MNHLPTEDLHIQHSSQQVESAQTIMSRICGEHHLDTHHRGALNFQYAGMRFPSLNLAIGSAIASIGLTIPVVAIVAIVMDWPLELGLDAKSITLLVLSLFVVSNSLRTGRTTSLPGVVHLVIFAAYLFFSFAP